MKKNFNIFIFALVCLCGISLTACKNDDNDGVAKAVLASVTGLNFETTDNPTQIITVYSDAQWTCEHNDWIKVEPTTGSGTTEVRITVLDNLRDGTPDNPRKGEVIFKGATKASEAHVVLRQSGDLFRDVQPITIAQMIENEDESVAIISNLTSVANLQGSVIATDGKDNVLIQTAEAIPVGTAFTLQSVKSYDSQNMGVLQAHEIQLGGNVSELPEAIDITDQLDDNINVTERAYVSIAGKMEGKNILVTGKTNHGLILDAVSDIDLSALNGHSVVVYGFYSGTASPAVNIYASSVVDNGLLETIFFKEDFEWLAPWAAIGNGTACGQTVETDNPDANAPQLATPKVDGVSAYEALLAKGYEILGTHAASKSERKPEAQTYLQSTYLKFGLTGYYSGIVMTINEEISEDVDLTLSFDWCSMRQGSGTWDPTEIVVIINTDGNEVQYPIDKWNFVKDAAYQWITEKVAVKAGGIKKGSTITIRNADSQWPVEGSAPALRWFLDNVKIVAAD